LLAVSREAVGISGQSDSFLKFVGGLGLKRPRKSHAPLSVLQSAKQTRPSRVLRSTILQEMPLYGGTQGLTSEQLAEINQLKDASSAALSGRLTKEEALNMLMQRGFLTAKGQLKKIYRSA
jgi:hypothetical protein